MHPSFKKQRGISDTEKRPESAAVKQNENHRLILWHIFSSSCGPYLCRNQILMVLESTMTKRNTARPGNGNGSVSENNDEWKNFL